MASGARPADRPAAEPELEPDGLRSSAYGFAAWPPSVDQPLVDFVDRFLADDLGHAIGDDLGKLMLARIDPAYPAGQRGEQGYQSTADMARAEHCDLRLHCGHRFEQQHRDAAAALAEARAQAETLQMRGGALLLEHLPGDM